MKKIVKLLLLLFYCIALNAQNNFKADMIKNNPTKDKYNFGPSEVEAHKAFLKKAIAAKNNLHHLYGLIYLYKDYNKQSDFVTSSNYLVAAEKLAKASGKPGWIGSVMGYRASMTGLVQQNFQLAILQAKSAIQLCGKAKDSLCLAENYDRLGTLYNALGDYKKAHYYFRISMPLIHLYGSRENLSVAYNNFANLLFNQKEYETALVYYNKALSIAAKDNNLKYEMAYNANLGATYIELKEYDKALAVYDYCEPINAKNNWRDNLAKNQLCRSVIYEKQGRYKESLDNLKKYYNLEEEITGEKVNYKITTLEEKYKKEEQQLILKKKQLELEKSLRAKERYAGISFSMLSAIFIGLWLWRKQIRRNRKEALENQKNLTDLTNLMIEKNKVVLELEEKLSTTNAENISTQEEETTLYSQRILTDNDWTSFKNSFEKVYPGYIKKVRDQYPKITEAEERLFLCLKLNLKSKETALMLGISNDSVKKNRSRLRKRLNLIEKEDLEAFVRNFADNIFQKTG